MVETIAFLWYPAAFAAAFTLFTVEALTRGESFSARDTVPFEIPSLLASSLIETYAAGFVTNSAIWMQNAVFFAARQRKKRDFPRKAAFV